MGFPPILFVGAPGGMELAVVFFLAAVLFGVPLSLLVTHGYRVAVRRGVLTAAEPGQGASTGPGLRERLVEDDR